MGIACQYEMAHLIRQTRGLTCSFESLHVLTASDTVVSPNVQPWRSLTGGQSPVQAWLGWWGRHFCPEQHMRTSAKQPRRTLSTSGSPSVRGCLGLQRCLTWSGTTLAPLSWVENRERQFLSPIQPASKVSEPTWYLAFRLRTAPEFIATARVEQPETLAARGLQRTCP